MLGLEEECDGTSFATPRYVVDKAETWFVQYRHHLNKAIAKASWKQCMQGRLH